MNNTTVKRIDWIDTAKALAIILVGIGHYACPLGLKTWIYTFHMPLFFMLSGYTLNIDKYNFREFLARKAKTLLLPWVIGIVAYAIFQNLCLMLNISAVDIPMSSVFSRILVNWRISFGGIYDPVYWFIPCLFITEIVLYFVLKVFKTKRTQIVLLIIFIVMAYLYEKFINVILLWEIDVLPVTCFYVTLGFFVKRYYINIINNISKVKCFGVGMVLLGAGSALGFLNRYISGKILDISSGTYGVIIISIVAAIFGSLGIILLCRLVNIKLIKYIGENSLYFYLLQPLTYKMADIILVICLPFYTCGGNAFNIVLLHIVNNIFILVYIVVYKKLKNEMIRKVMK